MKKVEKGAYDQEPGTSNQGPGTIETVDQGLVNTDLGPGLVTRYHGLRNKELVNRDQDYRNQGPGTSDH
jgi:hypothetical protein